MSGVTDFYRFIISIPVADRPPHLRNCLESIYQLGERYAYRGGMTIVVAEDSREPPHIDAHKALVAEYCAKGLDVIHFHGVTQSLSMFQSRLTI